MSYNDRIDPRFGHGYPDCVNGGRVTVHLDFGLGHEFDTQYQSGAVASLLRAVATIRAINDDPNDPRAYHVDVAGHRVAGGYDVGIAGTYSCRPINNPHLPGSQDPSPHSWPVAIDINPKGNGWADSQGDHPDWFRQAFLDEGFSWGGDWGDPMHYERLDWVGEWDGTYPEVDDVALTSEQAAALDFIAANQQGIQNLLDLAAGILIGADGTKKEAGKDATLGQKAGFRLARELNLQQSGGH
jgi:hypothetical protein